MPAVKISARLERDENISFLDGHELKDTMIKVADKRMAWQSGMTLDQVLALLEDGHLYAVVRLNGRLISRPYFAVTEVPDESFIEPVPMIAGG